MSELCRHTPPLQTRFLSSLKRLLILSATAFLIVGHAAADEQDDRYLHAFSLIQQGDTLNKNGQATQAQSKYRQAAAALTDLQRTFPDWHPKAVAFRLGYLAKQLTAPAANVTETKPKAAGESGGAQVKLLDPGAEPRKALRLHPTAGGKQTMTMTMKMAMEMKMGDMPSQPLKMPGMKMVMDVTVKSVSDNGDIAFETVMNEADITEQEGVLPQIAEAMKGSLAGLKGLSSTGVISSRGVTKSSEVKVPENADAQTKQAIEQMKEAMSRTSLPLPEEPIGVGAKWEAKMPIKAQGMTLDQTAAYELVSIDGEQLNAKTTISQTASNQKIENPSMPGVKVDLTKMISKATGNTTIDLTQVAPAMASMDSHSDMSMAMNMGAQKQPMDMKLDLNLQIESK